MTPRERQSGCVSTIFALESDIDTGYDGRQTDLWQDVHRELNADDNNERLLREFGLLSDSGDSDDDDNAKDMVVEAPPVANKAPRFQTPLEHLRARIVYLARRRETVREMRLELAENREEVKQLKDSFASRHKLMTRLTVDSPLPARDYAAEYATLLENNSWLQEKMILINRWPEVLDQCEKLALSKHPLYHLSCLDNVLDLLDDTAHYSAMSQKEASAMIRRLDSATLLMDVAAGRTRVKFIMDDQYYIFIAQELVTLSIQAYIVIRKDALVV